MVNIYFLVLNIQLFFFSLVLILHCLKLSLLLEEVVQGEEGMLCRRGCRRSRSVASCSQA